MQLPRINGGAGSGEISYLVDKSEKSGAYAKASATACRPRAAIALAVAQVIVPRVNEWFYEVKMNRLNVYS